MKEDAGTTIFYVDDDADDRSFFAEVTMQIGQSVSLFELGEEMLTKLENPPPQPSVVFLDLNMPVKNGFEVLEDIKNSDAFGDLPIIILSTTNNPDTVKKCFSLGASLYIQKTPSLSDLRKSLEHVLSIDWDKHERTSQNFLFKG